MKNVRFILGAGSVLAAVFVLGGCGKPAAPPPTVEAKATPSPTPLTSLLDGKDLDSGKLRAKANKAADSIGKYLETQDPKLREKFQQLSNKVAGRFGQDKDHWREKLEAKRHELEPQIEKLKAQLAKEGGQTKDKLREELSELETRNDTTEQKLSKLEVIGADAWKKFKAQLKDDEARERTPPVDSPDPSPAPSR